LIGSGVFPVMLPWLALLFPIPTTPNTPGGQSSPKEVPGRPLPGRSSGWIAVTMGAGCWGASGVNDDNGVSWWWCSSVVPYSAIFLPVGSLLTFGAWHAVLCPLADYSLVAPHSTLTLIYRCGYPARFHLGSPWRLFCGVPTAGHPHPWLVPYMDRTDTRDFCLLVVLPYSYVP